MSKVTPNSMNQQDEVFTEILLPSGAKAVILEGTGAHYFEALRHAKGDAVEMSRYLILRLVRINGSAILDINLDNMSMRDVICLMEAINAMLTTHPL